METTTATPAAQPRPDRFLMLILIGVILLLLGGAISVVALRQPAPVLPADTPGGTIQGFFTALEQKDYNKAYDFLSNTMPNKPTREEFVRQNSNVDTNNQQRRIRIDTERVNADQATVTVAITLFYNSRLPFGSSEYTSTETFSLEREAGTWRISALPFRYNPQYRGR